jgi:GMP synthase-like glutamine amidotransferase
MKRVLALQFDRDDPPGNLGEIMQEHGIAWQTVNAEEEAIPDPASFAAVLAMGGPQHVGHHERDRYLDDAVGAIQRSVELDVPVLGLCLGGQLLAYAMGAEVRKHTSTPIGFYRVQLTGEGSQDPLFAGLPGYQQVFHWHEDTFDIPRNAVPLATNAATRNQAFRYGRSAYGTQYHIELTPGMMNSWLLDSPFHEEIVKWIGEEGAVNAAEEGRRLYPLYREHSRIMFENFLRIAGLLP